MSLYITYGAYKAHLFDNQELLELVIIFFSHGLYVGFKSNTIRRNKKPITLIGYRISLVSHYVSLCDCSPFVFTLHV